MTRQEKYVEICTKAKSLILTELEENGFDTDEMDVLIKIKNYDFDEEFEM